MKKVWNTPIMDELSISLTANGATPNEPFDGPWEQIDPNDPNSKWVKPGCSR